MAASEWRSARYAQPAISSEHRTDVDASVLMIFRQRVTRAVASVVFPQRRRGSEISSCHDRTRSPNPGLTEPATSECSAVR